MTSPTTAEPRQLAHPNRYRTKRFDWTDAAIATALRLKARRVSNKGIAHRLGTTRRVVQYKLYNHKFLISRPSGGPTHPCSKQPIEWDEQTLSKLLRLTARGVRQVDIAAALGTTVVAVKAKLSTLRNTPHGKPEIKKDLPCLGCGEMMNTTIETRQCDACKSLDRYKCGLWR